MSRARHQGDRAVEEVERVRRAAHAHDVSLTELFDALANLPRPAGASEEEERTFRDELRAYRIDITQIVEMLGRDLRAYVSRGQS